MGKDLITSPRTSSINSSLDQIFEKLPDNTRKTYTKAINQFLDFCKIGMNQITQISAPDIMDYIQYLKTKYSTSTMNVKIASLKTLFNKLAVLYQIPNPFTTLKKLKVKTTFQTKRAVSRDMLLRDHEVSQILNYLKQNPSFTNTRNYCLLRLLFETGLRISEALSITLENIKQSNSGAFLVRITGKGHKEREVYILPDLYNQIKTISTPGYIFKSLKGNQLNRTSFHKTLKRLGKKILNKNISAHCLRHSHITAMIEKHPQKIKAISLYAGHSSTSVTLNMYMHDEILPGDIQSIAVQ